MWQQASHGMPLLSPSPLHLLSPSSPSSSILISTSSSIHPSSSTHLCDLSTESTPQTTSSRASARYPSRGRRGALLRGSRGRRGRRRCRCLRGGGCVLRPEGWCVSLVLSLRILCILFPIVCKHSTAPRVLSHPSHRISIPSSHSSPSVNQETKTGIGVTLVQNV